MAGVLVATALGRSKTCPPVVLVGALAWAHYSTSNAQRTASGWRRKECLVKGVALVAVTKHDVHVSGSARL